MKRLLLLASLLLLPSACQYQEPKDPQTLLYHFKGEPDTLNPLTSTDAYASRVQGLIYDSLIDRDNQSLEFKPKLAESWEVSPDKMVYTFHLRAGVKWHDGKPVTADDIVYSFDQIMNEKVDAPHLRSYYQDVAKVEKLDASTVRFTYAKPYFKALEFVGGIPIIPKHVYDDGQDFNQHPANRHPVGNGAYRFVAWHGGKTIELERNEDYWDKSHFPDIRKIKIKIIPDDTVSLQVLKKNELDFTNLRPIQWVKQTGSPKFEDQFVKHQYDSTGYRYIGWNLRRPFFQDRKVREALTRLVNRQVIVDKLEYGLGKVISGPFWINGYEYNQDISPLPFDPAGAKKLLGEAGWVDGNGDGVREKDGAPFEFDFLIPAGADFYERLATIMKRDFEDAGIRMNIRTMEWSTFVQRLNGRDFDAVSLAWSGSFDEDPYQIWHSSQAEKGSNFIGFINGEADKMLEDARQTFDKQKRAKIYHRFHELIAREQPYTFLYNGPALVVRDKRFQNVQVYRGGLDIFEWKVPKLEESSRQTID